MILRLILGDQLNGNISSLRDVNKLTDSILICEVKSEATYVKHHKKKIAFLFSAMRHFSKFLEESNFKLKYVKYDDVDNSGSLFGEVKKATDINNYKKIIVTKPNEFRLYSEILEWENKLNIHVEIRDDDRFLCTTDEFNTWANDRKQLRMEFFYRNMRRKYNILMDGDEPIGGQWNYDSENRKPPKNGLKIPDSYSNKPDEITKDVIKLVDQNFKDHFGDLLPFNFAVTRQQALIILDEFIDKRLGMFGDFQDAMIEGEPWMFHSHISFYLNCGLLTPLECIKAVESAFYDNRAPLNAVEGFIRQVLGWREYIRGVYWYKMPEYKSENFLEASRKLPEFYWTGKTNMNCLKQCITETKENSYAHHIQRLMVLGNFVLLTGIKPDEVNNWYLAVYSDAYEWVELPNVTGMILYADGGVLASKPYAASGAYINRMSNYCKSCHYKVSSKNGEDACPFNYLYWDFLIRNENKLRNNPRMGLIYRNLDKMKSEKFESIRSDSNTFLKRIENNEKV
ncbi:cryptochrome/photolyase family protein [Amylibacter sp.]|nr:cryptochrome/photolyase family protein [Amylibacter sp.]